MKYTQVPADAFQKLQLNAGILVTSFTPASGVIGDIMGVTSGGMTFASNPTYSDAGDGLDNVPANTWQLKRVSSYDPTMSGTFKTIDAASAASLAGASDVDSSDPTHVVPRDHLVEDDFTDVWWVGDYSDKNSDTGAGYVAIHLMNALNGTGIQIKSNDDGRGDFAFEYHAHYDMSDIEKIPFELYVKSGS